jgi:hypothetical protein
MRWITAASTIPLLALSAALFAVLFPCPASTDQPSYDTVGPIEGEDISVQGPLNIEVVQGRTRTILRSGSDVRVNSGQARIDLIEGGQIAVCGPAHLSVLKSVNLLTLALDTGIIHAHIQGPQPSLTIYTAQIQAKPFAITDAPQDTLVGFDPTGAMCIRADSGAVRIEQQLTGQSIVVPQSGEVLITSGQLESVRSGVTHCACESQLAKSLTPTQQQTEVSHLPSSEEMQKANSAAKSRTEVAKPNTQVTAKATSTPPKPLAPEDPVYQVFMPPLSYDASAKVQHDNFDPQLIVIVRRVRVRPTLIFKGTVTDAPVPHATTPPASPAKTPEASTPQKEQPKQKSPQANKSAIDRARAFFRSLFS